MNLTVATSPLRSMFSSSLRSATLQDLLFQQSLDCISGSVLTLTLHQGLMTPMFGWNQGSGAKQSPVCLRKWTGKKSSRKAGETLAFLTALHGFWSELGYARACLQLGYSVIISLLPPKPDSCKDSASKKPSSCCCWKACRKGS